MPSACVRDRLKWEKKETVLRSQRGKVLWFFLHSPSSCQTTMKAAGDVSTPSRPVHWAQRACPHAAEDVCQQKTHVRPSVPRPRRAATTSFPSRPSREPRGYFWGSLCVQDGCTVTDSVASRRMVNNGHRVAGAHWADVWQKKKIKSFLSYRVVSNHHVVTSLSF